MRNLSRFLVFTIMGGVLSSCDVAVHEAGRTASPDGKLDLVVTTTDGGATTSVGYHLNLVPRGDTVDLDDSNFVADKVYALTAEWVDSTNVIIRFENARIFHFSNFWHSKEVDNWQHVIRLKLN